MSNQTGIPGPILARPKIAMSTKGTLGWLRANLFSNWWNALLTVLALWLIVSYLPPLIDWLFISAHWGAADRQVCFDDRSGACWSMIHEKYRLILFGRYTYAEQWRPLVAILLVICTIAVSCRRKHWSRKLIYLWAFTLTAFLALMFGGFLGLSYIETSLWGGLPLTLVLSIFGMVAGFPIAILLALGRRSHMPAIKAVCVGYIELIRGVPLITLLFMASFMLPLFLPTGVSINELLRAQVAIIMFVSAYVAEVIRGGLQALPKGQFEAAAAMGLGYWQTTRKIIMPQAIRLVIPPIVNTFIGMFKDTSLVAIVGLTDLLLAARQAIADPEWRFAFIEAYLFIALIYFCFCFFMSKYSQYLEYELYGRTTH
ncbi:MAG: amino acid ABC transporter permease [Rhodospirillaceae bacterium]|jgi:general L-amino acid transport system permease protein|nr:amino acid ABC transporter permease [Rhodospirillaceae bacterium]